MPYETTSPPSRPRIGLALGAGVARGWAHIGVVRALTGLGITPDVVAGTSIGALVGGAYLAGHLDTLEHWARGLTRLKIVGYMDFRLRAGGMIAGNRLVAEMRRHLEGIQVQTLPRPFVSIATDLMSGHEVWIRDGSLIDALRASFALPGVFPPVRRDDRWLVDGALVNPVPVAACRALGAQLVIAVNLNADVIGKVRRAGGRMPVPPGFDLLEVLQEAPESPPPRRLEALARRLFQRDYAGPSLFGVMACSLNIIQDRITRSRLAGEPPDVHVTPRLGHLGLMEFDRADEAIAEGMAALERSLPDLRESLQVLGCDVPEGDATPPAR